MNGALRAKPRAVSFLASISRRLRNCRRRCSGASSAPVASELREADMPRDGSRLEDAAIAGLAHAPCHVGVACPQRHVLVEDLGADGDGVQRLAAIEHARAVAAEDVARALVLRARIAMADQRVLAPAVDRHARGVDDVEPLLGLHAGRAQDQRRDGADARLAEPPGSVKNRGRRAVPCGGCWGARGRRVR